MHKHADAIQLGFVLSSQQRVILTQQLWGHKCCGIGYACSGHRARPACWMHAILIANIGTTSSEDDHHTVYHAISVSIQFPYPVLYLTRQRVESLVAKDCSAVSTLRISIVTAFLGKGYRVGDDKFRCKLPTAHVLEIIAHRVCVITGTYSIAVEERVENLLHPVVILCHGKWSIRELGQAYHNLWRAKGRKRCICLGGSSALDGARVCIIIHLHAELACNRHSWYAFQRSICKLCKSLHAEHHA